MRYMLMFVDGVGVRGDAPNPDVRKTHSACGEWYAKLRAEGKLEEGYELKPAWSATTLVINGQRTSLVDGPFADGGETFGGYCILDVEDLDEAISLARTWPIRQSRVEIRPIVDRQ